MTEGPDRDEHGRKLADARLWQTCQTFEAALDLAARWFEGTLSYMPGMPAPSPNSTACPDLRGMAELNRAGLLTIDGRQGRPLENGSGSRQFVVGFGTEGTAGKLLALSCRSDLVIAGHAPGTENHANIPAVAKDGTPARWLGRTKGMNLDGGWELWAEEANPVLADTLSGLWYLEAFDPRWGRSDALLPSMLEALRG